MFDRLFDRARYHTHAGVYMANSWPMETIFVSILLEVYWFSGKWRNAVLPLVHKGWLSTGGYERSKVLPRKAGPPTSFWGQLKSFRSLPPCG